MDSAPEVDPATIAPEHYPLPDGIQVSGEYLPRCCLTHDQTAFSNELELRRDQAPPICVINSEVSKEVVPGLVESHLVGRRSLIRIATGTTIFLVVLGIALGVDSGLLGDGLPLNRHPQQQSQTVLTIAIHLHCNMASLMIPLSRQLSHLMATDTCFSRISVDQFYILCMHLPRIHGYPKLILYKCQARLEIIRQ